jgi:hypothetical protein
MPTRLRKLKITRVAVCPQGANYDPETGEGAHILLFKAADPALKQDDGAATCTDTDCADAACPVHGTAVRRTKKRLAKGPVSEMGTHAEPDGDEVPPLDYRSRGQQYDLWERLWQKWQCLCTTFHDCCGDWDSDNIPYLPIFVDSLGQFRDDVQQLLVDCGVSKQVAPLLRDLADLCVADVTKAGAAMAAHRRERLEGAIAALQQLLEECTPEECPHGILPPIDRAGVSAAEVAVIPVAMKHQVGDPPARAGGDDPMAVHKNTESDKEHCENCDDKDCDNPAHERMQKQEDRMAERDTALASAQAELASTRAELDTTKAALAKAEQDLASLHDEQRIAKMSPEEQREHMLTQMPELVRKSYLDQEARLELIEKANADLFEKNQRLDYIAKTAELRDFGMNPDDHWEHLRAIDQWPEPLRTEHLRLLKAASEQMRTSPWMTSLGSEGRPMSGTNGSAEQQLMALAQSHSTEKGVPLGQAIEAIQKTHPDLYQRHILEKRQTNRV